MTEWLPAGWINAKMGEITTKVGSGSTPRGGSETYQQVGTPFIRSMNVRFEGFSKDGLAFLTQSQAEALREVTVRSGDVLLNITGASIGRVTQAPAQMDGARVNQHVCILRMAPEIDSEFVSKYLASPSVQSQIWSEQYGVTRQALTKAQILDFDIPLAPAAEQRRIIEEIRALFAQIDSARQHLSRLFLVLKRFRLAVLTAASSGRLTEDWRECRSLRNGSRQLGPSEAHTFGLFEIPESWEWCRCEQVCNLERAITYGVIKLGSPVPEGVPTLRSSDVRWLRIDEREVKRISPQIAKEYSRTFLNGGEVLVTVRGSLGGVAVVPEHMAGFNISREVAVLPIADGRDATYVSLAIASNWAQRWLMNVSKGVAYTGINIRDLKQLPIPVPPLDEQREIVRRAKLLLSLADEIEERMCEATAQVERIPKSILAKAFRGELVPTEAELARREGRGYEPASALLERILAERANHAKSPPVSKHKLKKSSALVGT
jgi:type I restriction enzyme S subunit